MKYINEKWRHIGGSINYEVSSFGRVRNNKFKRILKGVKDKRKGSFMVKIDGKRDFVHRLVAKVFIPNPDNFETVHHIDFNNTNNKVNNLMWLSREVHSSKEYRNPSKLIQYTRIIEILEKSKSIEEAINFFKKEEKYLKG